MKRNYHRLLEATNEIADGNLDVEIDENLGVFEPFKEEIEKIQTGFKKAVDEEVKSQRMKTELVTNVSHDLEDAADGDHHLCESSEDGTGSGETERIYRCTG